jgi:sterol desaturase/sphingolipid hydroxylase (fatty acid hydroxylase superfamily)
MTPRNPGCGGAWLAIGTSRFYGCRTLSARNWLFIRETPESPRMFESDLFDLFSRTHPIIVPLLFVPGSAYLVYLSIARAGVAWLTTLGLFVLGFVVWTLAEYWLHRLFFHWNPPGKWGERLHFLVHGVHHTWPRDKYRLVMPPAVSITLYFVFGAIFYYSIGPVYSFGFHAGFVVGYMFYDLTHYWIHHFSPRTEYGRELKKNHMLHHFKDHSSRFCVSNLVWDKLFGTSGTK